MANEFVIKNGFHSKGDSQITGSLIVSSSTTGNELQIGDNNLIVSSSGNVGIGTTSPTTQLQVDGTISGSGLDIAGSGSFSDKLQSQGFLFGSNIIGSLGAANRYISDGGDAQDFYFNVPTSGRFRFAVNNSTIGGFGTTGVFSSNGLDINGDISGSAVSASTYYGDGSNLTGIEGITTSSLLTTASVSLNTITFTKGDASTFDITVDTGSGGGGAAFPYTGDAEITGSLIVSSSGVDIFGGLDVDGLTTIYKSGSTVFTIEGSQGTLFAVTDELSGSLFSVNDISGIPIFEVFSDDTVKIGTYNDEAIIVNGNSAIVTGSFTGSFAGDGDDLVIKRIHLATSQSATITGTADYQQWDVQLHYDSDIFEHSTVTNSDNIAVRSPGLYHVISTIGVANNTTVNRLTATGKIRVNGSTILHTIGSTYHRGNTYAGDATIKINSILNLSASDVVDIEIITDTFGGGTTVPEWSELHIYKLGTST